MIADLVEYITSEELLKGDTEPVYRIKKAVAARDLQKIADNTLEIIRISGYSLPSGQPIEECLQNIVQHASGIESSIAYYLMDDRLVGIYSTDGRDFLPALRKSEKQAKMSGEEFRELVRKKDRSQVHLGMRYVFLGSSRLGFVDYKGSYQPKQLAFFAEHELKRNK